MASKVHCDICDVSPATDRSEKEVPFPDSHPWDKKRLLVKVFIYGKSDEERRQDVCHCCMNKLIAGAFGLRTPEELYELRDQVTELTRQLALVRAGEDPPSPPAPRTTVYVEVPADTEIPF